MTMPYQTFWAKMLNSLEKLPEQQRLRPGNDNKEFG